MHHEQQPHDVFLSRVLHCCAGGTVGHICAHVWAGLEAGAIPNDERLSVKSFCEHEQTCRSLQAHEELLPRHQPLDIEKKFKSLIKRNQQSKTISTVRI